MANKEELILDAITKLSNKVDELSSKIGDSCESRLDSKTIAIITAAAYSLFGRRVAVRSVRLLDDNPTGKNRFRQFSVVADE